MARGTNRNAMRLPPPQRPVGSGRSARIAAGTVATWQLLAVHLAPLIGARGFDVLLSRSLHITSRTIAWLGDDWGGEQVATRSAMLAAVELRLADAEASVATEASSAMFMNFSVILTSLIGEPLAQRLLGPVWAQAARVSEKEVSP
jgi:hypothetical protein